MLSGNAASQAWELREAGSELGRLSEGSREICSWGWKATRTKGRNRNDHQERKAVWLGSSRWLRKPWVALKAKPDGAPDPMGDCDQMAVPRTQHQTQVSTSREEVTKIMEKEQLTASWKT